MTIKSAEAIIRKAELTNEAPHALLLEVLRDENGAGRLQPAGGAALTRST